MFRVRGSRVDLLRQHQLVLDSCRGITGDNTRGGAKRVDQEAIRHLSDHVLLSGDDLELDTEHSGCWLLCRTLTDPVRMVAITSIVECPDGSAHRLSLYNWEFHGSTPNRALPVDSIIGLMCPYFKVSLDGGTGLRVDDPEDLVFIPPTHPILNRVCKKWFSGTPGVVSQKKWKPKGKPRPPEAENTTLAPKLKSSEDWRKEGNEFFAKSQFIEALRCYTESSMLDQFDALSWSNIAAVHLKLEDWPAAIKASDQALERDPTNAKALLRKGKAYMQMERFRDALEVLEVLISSSELIPEAAEMRQACLRLRAQAESGKYDWNSLLLKTMVNSNTRFSVDTVADYKGPIEVLKGNGVRAARDLAIGTLVVVSKPLVASFANENVSLGRKLMSRTRGEGDKILELSSQFHLDHASIDEIINQKAFVVSGWNILPERKTTEIQGLWIVPSMFRLNCASNCSVTVVGDILVMRTNSFVKKGSELLLSQNAVKWIASRCCYCDRCRYLSSLPKLASNGPDWRQMYCLRSPIPKSLVDLKTAINTKPTTQLRRKVEKLLIQVELDLLSLPPCGHVDAFAIYNMAGAYYLLIKQPALAFECQSKATRIHLSDPYGRDQRYTSAVMCALELYHALEVQSDKQAETKLSLEQARKLFCEFWPGCESVFDIAYDTMIR